jgi:hypothetical protein
MSIAEKTSDNKGSESRLHIIYVGMWRRLNL